MRRSILLTLIVMAPVVGVLLSAQASDATAQANLTADAQITSTATEIAINSTAIGTVNINNST